jgi:uncharacterized RDD family membrane protein YckC
MTEQQMLRSDTSDPSQTPDGPWREEIQARVARYRTRRGRRIEGTYSLRFPFAPGEEAAATAPELSVTVLEAEGDDSLREEVPMSAAVAEEAVLEVRLAAAVEGEVPEIALNVVEEARTGESLAEQPPQETLNEGDPAEFGLQSGPQPGPASAPRPAAKRKVIAFPRQATVTEDIYEMYRLADPVVAEQPRILDVPEELEPFPTTPLFDGLHLPAVQQSAAPSPDHIDLPFQAAPLSRRIWAGAVDCGLVAVGAAMFGGIVYKLTPALQLTKPVLLTAAAIPFLLWAAYQYLLLMYGGATAGMQVAKVRLSTFKGIAPDRRRRRSRILALYFSAASLLMGVLWALVDVDHLCWHDRISHTYLTKGE